MATAASQQGKIRLHLVDARLTRDTEWIGKMDPYCKIETRSQRLKTRVIDGAGKTPRWN